MATEKIVLRLDLDTENIGAELRRVRAEYQKTLAAVKQELATYERLVRITKDTIAEKGDKTGKLTKQLITYETEVRRLKNQQRELQHSIDLTTKAEDAQARSYKQVSALAELQKRQLNELGGTLQKNADGTLSMTNVYRQFAAQVKNNNDGLIAFDLNVSRGGRNVGNYANSILSLKERLKELKAAAEAMDVGSDEFKRTRAEIMKLTNDIQRLSGQYDEFGKRIKRNPMAEGMASVSEVTQGAVSAIHLFTLATADANDAALIQAQALKAMATAQALSNVQKGIAKLQTAALAIQMRIVTAAQQAHTAAMTANIAVQKLLQAQLGLTAGAARVLGTALSAIGITALIAGIGLLISYLARLRREKSEAAKASSDLVRELEKQKEILNIIGGTLEEQRDIELRINQAKINDYRLKMQQKKKLTAEEQEDYKRLLDERDLIDIRYHAARRKREEETAQLIKERQFSILETELQLMQIRNEPLIRQLEFELKINKARLDSYGDVVKQQGRLDEKQQNDYQRLLNERRILEARLAEERKRRAEEVARVNEEVERIRTDTELQLMQLRGESQARILEFELQQLDQRMKIYEDIILSGKQLTAEQTIEFERLIGQMKIKKQELDNVLKTKPDEKEDQLAALQQGLDLEMAKLEGQFLLGLKSEAEYNDARIKMLLDYYDKKLAIMREQGQQETVEFTRTENEKLKLMRETNQAIIEAQMKTAEMRTELVLGTVEAFANVLEKYEGFARIGFLFEKAFAIAQIIVNLQRELSSIAASNAILGPQAPAVIAAQSAIAKARAAQRIGVVIATTIGEFVTQKKARGGVVKMYGVGGKPHTEGGTMFVGEDGTMFEAERDEVIAVINKRSANVIRWLSTINVMGGGVPFFEYGGVVPKYQDGGLAARTLSAAVTVDNSALVDALSRLQLFVSVSEINDVQAKVKAVQSRAAI